MVFQLPYTLPSLPVDGKKSIHYRYTCPSSHINTTSFMHSTFSRQLAVGCHENLCVWEPDTGALLYKFTTTKEIAVTSLCYSPNGAHLAVGLTSGEIQVFDIDSNSCIFTLRPHKEVS